MQRIILSAIVLSLTLLGWNGRTASAQHAGIRDGAGLGMQVNQYQRDFGVGLHVTSPYVANGSVAVRLRGNVMYNEHVQDGRVTWTSYANAALGVIGASGKVEDLARFYGEGGLVGLFPSDAFSSEDFVFGGYGLFGFEFFMAERNAFFIEIGGVGTGARADAVASEPIYSNGLLVAAGFRLHL